MNIMNPATKEKLKPYSSIFVFIGYLAIALIWGCFFLGATDGMLYSLVTSFFLTPAFASYSVYQLAVKASGKIAVLMLLVYALVNAAIQCIVFFNPYYPFYISPSKVMLVLIPAGICLLFGALRKFKSRSKSESE